LGESVVVEVELQSGDPFQQVNQVGQVTEDEEEQEPDSGEEETQV